MRIVYKQGRVEVKLLADDRHYLIKQINNQGTVDGYQLRLQRGMVSRVGVNGIPPDALAAILVDYLEDLEVRIPNPLISEVLYDAEHLLQKFNTLRVELHKDGAHNTIVA